MARAAAKAATREPIAFRIWFIGSSWFAAFHSAAGAFATRFHFSRVERIRVIKSRGFGFAAAICIGQPRQEFAPMAVSQA
jgi:adenine/guanine phosphoribosyltransferase-like PRPP-binding protein